MTILEKIITKKKNEVERCRATVPLHLLEQRESFRLPVISLRESLLRPGSSGIIAEFKRKSPSKGLINNRAEVSVITTGYVSAGASALSVLTDQEYFGGTLEDLVIARTLNKCPVLRKDFIIDEYQVVESKAAGADVVLLIASLLTAGQVLTLAGMAKKLGLEVILEVHETKDLHAVNQHIDIIGVNNRDLNTFRVDPGVSERLYPLIPEELTAIAESGISNRRVIDQLIKTGYRGFLIGEYFMSKEDPVAACKELIAGLESNE
jgi:indole-3-glycerol phosphate synthase